MHYAIVDNKTGQVVATLTSLIAALHACNRRNDHACDWYGITRRYSLAMTVDGVSVCGFKL